MRSLREIITKQVRIDLRNRYYNHHLIYAFISLFILLTLPSWSADMPMLSIYPKIQGTIRVVIPSIPDGIIIGRVVSIIASKKGSGEVSLYPAELKGKTPGIYTDIPTSSPIWDEIGDGHTKWRLQKPVDGWEQLNVVINFVSTTPPTGELLRLADFESIAASKRSVISAKPNTKRINGRLSVVLRGLERLVQSKGSDLFVQLCVDGRAVSVTNNLTSPLIWSSTSLPDGCYLVEIKAYTNGINQLLFNSTQLICVLNDL